MAEPPIRDAAALIVVDDVAGRPRVLMGRRSADQVFLPNVFVFPGGRCDAQDAFAPSADELAPDEAGLLRLQLDGSRLPASHGRALALAAVRETFEETGYIAGTARQGTQVTAPDSVRGQPQARAQESASAPGMPRARARESAPDMPRARAQDVAPDMPRARARDVAPGMPQARAQESAEGGPLSAAHGSLQDGSQASASWQRYQALGFIPKLSSFRFFLRAITPPARPRRYDTRFFIVNAREFAHQTMAVDEELSDVGWYALDELETLAVARITRVVIGELERALETGLAPAHSRSVPVYLEQNNVMHRAELSLHRSLP